MIPRVGERVTLLLVSPGRDTQRVTGVVVELFDDVRESDTAIMVQP